MGFREQLADDAERVFLNVWEFAETVDIDGVAVKAVHADASHTGYSTRDRYRAEMYPELPGREVVLHVRTADLRPELAMGGTCRLDGELCTVEDRHDGLGGMTRITLRRNGY